MQQFGGISRYFAELMNRFVSAADIDIEMALTYSSNAYLTASNLFNRVNVGEATSDFLLPVNFKGKTRLHKGFTQIGLANNPEVLNKKFSILKIKKEDYDLFHPTWFDSYFIALLKRKPFVLTIHDMIHERYAGRFFNHNDPVIKAKRLCAEKASKIISVSESTKKDILEFYGFAEDKVDVVYHGCSLSPGIDPCPESLTHKSYLLYVGDRHAYKNFNFFIEAIGTLLASTQMLQLICVGGTPFSRSETMQLSRLNVQNQVLHMPFVDDSNLIALYQQAICFVFPSLCEGFGLTVLEAFSCGCPVVLSHTPALKEVAGDAAQYFDPNSMESIHYSVKRVLEDASLRTALRTKGKERLKAFSWDKCASDTKSIYQQIIG